MKVKVVKFLGPLISAILLFILFCASFPAIGECGATIIVLIPVLLVSSMFFGWILLKLKKYWPGLIIISILIFFFLLFFYPVTCTDSPFSAISNMAKILSSKSAITYSDQLRYNDREKKLASVKKLSKDFSPERVYVASINHEDSIERSIIFLKDGQAFSIDTSLIRHGSENTLYAMVNGDTIKLFFKDNHVDTNRVKMINSFYVISPAHEAYSLHFDNDTYFTLTYNDETWNRAYDYQNYWAYGLFYWLF